MKGIVNNLAGLVVTLHVLELAAGLLDVGLPVQLGPGLGMRVRV